MARVPLLPVLLLLLLVALTQTSWAAAVHEARSNRHPSSRQTRAEQCKATLLGLRGAASAKQRKAQAFCRSYLGVHALSASTTVLVTLPASTSTTTSTTTAITSTTITITGTTTTQTTQANEQTTTTTTTTAYTTTTSPAQRRRSVALESRAADHRHPGPSYYDALAKRFSDAVISDACQLLLYGRLQDEPVTTTSTTQLPASKTVQPTTTTLMSTLTSTASTTLVITNPPTSTSISTTTSTTTATVTVSPTPVIRDGGFEGPDDSAWTFAPRYAGISNGSGGGARSGTRFAYLAYFPPPSFGPTLAPQGYAQQSIPHLVVGQGYVITFYVRISFVHADGGSGSCTFTASTDSQTSANSVDTYTSEPPFSAAYFARTVTFVASATTAVLQFQMQCTGSFSGQMYVDDVSLLSRT